LHNFDVKKFSALNIILRCPPAQVMQLFYWISDSFSIELLSIPEESDISELVLLMNFQRTVKHLWCETNMKFVTKSGTLNFLFLIMYEVWWKPFELVWISNILWSMQV
jgi:hypothetical protein